MLRTVLSITMMVALATVASGQYNEVEAQYRVLETYKTLEKLAGQNDLRTMGRFYEASLRSAEVSKGKGAFSNLGGFTPGQNKPKNIDVTILNGTLNCCRGFILGLQYS